MKVPHEWQEEQGTETMSGSELMKYSVEERKKWISAMEEELKQLRQYEVYLELTQQEITARYRARGQRVKYLPSKRQTTKA